MKLRFVGMAFATLLLASSAARADLVTNGGFETGDFTGWTVTNDNLSFVYSSDPLYGPHGGTDEALLGAFGSDGTLSQTISDVAGQTLQLVYWIASDGNAPNDFSAMWNGNVIAGSALSNVGKTGYVEYIFKVVATGSDILAFTERNDNGFLSLDDVSLNVVPEPGTLALLGAGLAGFVAFRRRKAIKAAQF